MADLLAEGSASGHGSNGNDPLQPTIPQPQTSSPRSNIRGPRVIMRERQEREARREQERLRRAQAEQDARVQAEQRRQALERERAAVAAAATAAAGADAVPMTNKSQQPDPALQKRQQRAVRAAGGPTGPAQAIPPPQQASQPPQQRPARMQQAPQGPPPSTNPPQPPASQVPPIGAGVSAGGPMPPTGDTSGGSRPRNSFPHAFERWEALSAHWEGLTSFWIRQLQQRSEEIDQDPLSRQLARQVTDLSAAGANLFHAVVELQRLRASSERKFQRWFFEMRGEMERNTERQGMLEKALQEERRSHADAVREAVESDRSNSQTQQLQQLQRQLAEKNRELAISKEEARRAWEELGRRVQEEQDRVVALQEGQPTSVGGMQVVPMPLGLPGRQRASSSATSQDPYTSQTARSTQQSPPVQQVQQTQPAQQVQSAQLAPPSRQAEQPSPTLSAVEGLPSQQRAAQYPAHSAAATQQATTESAGPRSDVTYSEEEEEETLYETPSSLPPSTTYPPSSSQHYYAPQPPVDYSGQGYSAPGWDTIPRHHHPTRLSDVMEEDERSRTSASQLSRA